MARIVRRPQAAADIAEIWDDTEDSLEQADAWVDRLDQNCARLRLPLMGRMRDVLSPRLRRIAFGRYIIF